MTLDLSALQTTLRQFAAERDWQPFHTPKNLAMALMVEAAELAEIFQWMTPEQSKAAPADRVVKERIGDEVADVLMYLLQLADRTGIDLDRAVDRKLVMNAMKHPPLRPGLPAGRASEAVVQTHVLIDWENVQPSEPDLRRLVPDVTDVWLFHGPHKKGIDALYRSFGDRVTLVPISRTGKNALDFHLSFYMGYIASRQPDAHIIVMANDRGYAPMVEHARELGFSARQIGFGGVAPSAAPAPAAPPKKAAPADATRALLQAVERVEANLQRSKGRPMKEAALVAVIASLLGPAANAESVPAVLSGLLAGGKVAIDDKGRVEYAF